MSTAGDRTLDQRMTSLEVAFATLSATLSTKLDALADQMKAGGASRAGLDRDIEARLRVLEADKPDPTHEPRISKLEQWRWLITGAALAGGGVMGGIVSAVWPG